MEVEVDLSGETNYRDWSLPEDDTSDEVEFGRAKLRKFHEVRLECRSRRAGSCI